MLGGFLIGVLMKRSAAADDDDGGSKRPFERIDSDPTILSELIGQAETAAANHQLPSRPPQQGNANVVAAASSHKPSVSSAWSAAMDPAELLADDNQCWPFSRDVKALVVDVLDEFDYEKTADSIGRLQRFCTQMHDALLSGLARDWQDCADDGTDHVEMLPTHVSNFASQRPPDGALRQQQPPPHQFLGLYLSGLNLRCSLLQRGGGGQTLDDSASSSSKSSSSSTTSSATFELLQRSFKIPRRVATEGADAVADYVARQLAEFAEQYGVNDGNLPLGVVMAAPMRHDDIAAASVISAPAVYAGTAGLLDRPVQQLLNDAFDRLPSLRVNLVAIANDTVSAQMSTAFEHSGHCDLGVIVSNDTNAAVMLPLDKVPKLRKRPRYDHMQQMLLNCEWCGFGRLHSVDYLLNQFDYDVAVDSGDRVFNQIVGASRQGEYVRLLLRHLVGIGALFTACPAEAADLLDQPDSFPHKWLSEILQDDSEELYETRAILDEYGLTASLACDLALVRQACAAVSRRSAQLLAAACVAAVRLCGAQPGNSNQLSPSSSSSVVIGVDGTVVRQHPCYYDWLVGCIGRLLPAGPHPQVVVALADGVGARGAALLAQAVTLDAAAHAAAAASG